MKKIVFYTLIGLLSFACEDVIELDLNTAPPRLAIDARLKINPNEQMIQVIKLSLTSGFYDENTTVVTTATVELLDITNSTTYTFVHDADTPGNYMLDFTPNLETDYKLIIHYENEVYESSVEQLMPTVPIDSLVQGNETLFQGDEKEVLVTITDDGTREDVYIFDFGYNLFLMRAMAPPEISIKDIYGSVLPFVLLMVIALALIMAFPQIALWLPEYVYGK